MDATKKRQKKGDWVSVDAIVYTDRDRAFAARDAWVKNSPVPGTRFRVRYSSMGGWYVQRFQPRAGVEQS
jgi:hypothetical protein